MNTQTLLHQKKVRNMGTALAVITWLSIAICTVGILVLGVAIRLTGNLSPNRVELPKGITLDMTVGELLAADDRFMQTHQDLFSAHFILALIFYIILSVILLRIAVAWRRGEPFQRTAVLGFRWLGILMLGQGLFGWIYEILAPESLSGLLTYSRLYDLALGLFSGSYGVGLESAIVFLTLSWVLEHGRMLKDEQDLTV